MVKLTGYLQGRGRIGQMVVSSVAGESIARAYQPSVANPSTPAQVNQRARMKLASQMASVLSPVIAIPRKGLSSARNQFVSKNFAAFSAQDGNAMVTIENLQLTNGNAGLPLIVATRSNENGLQISLAEAAEQSVSRVVYNVFAKSTEQELQFVDSVVVEQPGNDGLFPASLGFRSGELVIFAYGMRDLSAAASAKYGQMKVASGTDIAVLVARRSIDASNFAFTKTRGGTMAADSNQLVIVPDGYSRLFLTATPGGSVQGAGVYENGSVIEITAVPAQGYRFAGWYWNTTGVKMADAATTTIGIDGSTIDLIARFVEDVPQVQILLQTDALDVEASVEGEGLYDVGSQVTISTSSSDPTANFQGWKKQGQSGTVSTQKTYTFTASADETYIAVWGTEL